MTPTPQVLIDSRIGSKDLIKYPPLNTCGELCQLPSGDVLINGNGPTGPVLVGVELKSIFDFISSINSGRLQATQVKGMLSDYDVQWLLTYGIYRASNTGNLQIRKKIKGKTVWVDYRLGSRTVSYTGVKSATIEVSQIGVLCDHVFDPSARTNEDHLKVVAMWVGSLARWWGKKWTDHKLMRAFDTSGPELRKGIAVGLMPVEDQDVLDRAKVAASLPGIRYERAISIARAFSSVREMVNAGPEVWAEIPIVSRTGSSRKLGKVIAGEVDRFLGPRGRR